MIQALNTLIETAITHRASDLHFEPYPTHYQIRMRQDGILYDIMRLDAHVHLIWSARLKIMSGLNIAEKRLPQDGQFCFTNTAHNTYWIRISTIPVYSGEKIVLRFLNANAKPLALDTLGLNSVVYQHFIQHLHDPQGLILITGPTGSGKTQTLYSALNVLNQSHHNITALEDPIEIQTPGINQMQMHPKIGLTFSTALRALLRQDPDIIMIGEIRDPETAALAIQAAQTGHLVLASLHTAHAHGTLKRLQHLNISSTDLQETLRLILNQRLVRKRCGHCLHVDHDQRQSCPYCRGGYYDRTGIFECVTQHHGQFETHATLKSSGLEKINAQITDHAELTRVLGALNHHEPDDITTLHTDAGHTDRSQYPLAQRAQYHSIHNPA